MSGSPPPWRDVQAALGGASVAHRGLWSQGAPENSLPAFLAAAAAGYGVELDVRLTADGEAVVFHDADTLRMTGRAGRIEALDLAAVADLRLAGGVEAPPTLAAVLEALGDGVLVLVELKTAPGAEGPLEGRVAAHLDAFAPLCAVIGFNPGAHAWFRENRPKVVRGLNVSRAEELQAVGPGGAALEVAAPNFLLPELRAAAAPAAQRERASGRPLVAWTSRSRDEDLAARMVCDGVIFEGYRP
jgi:glycerophosphoryl diester phosphodiesterase